MRVGLLAGVVLVASLALNGYQYNQKTELQDKYTKLESNYNALKDNKKETVSRTVKQFLEALYSYKDTPNLNKLKYISTQDVQNQLFPAGSGSSEFKGETKISINSNLQDVVVFHQPAEERDNLAKVLVKFEQVMIVNGVKSETPNIADIELIYENGVWRVSKFSSLQQLEKFKGA